MTITPAKPPSPTSSVSETGLPRRRLSVKPLYQQIKESLIQRVLQGDWLPGEAMPSEMRLAEEYGVSQGTVRKAIEEMAAARMVVRRQGKGTFVVTHTGKHEPFRFYRVFSDDGELAVTSTRYLSCETAEASAEDCRILGIAPKTPVVNVVRLRGHDSHPDIVEYITLRGDLCPGIAPLLMRDQPESIYTVLEREYNILVLKVEERLRAVAADAGDAHVLNVPKGAPLLEIRRVGFSLGEQPVEWRFIRCQTDDIYYLNRIGA